MKILLVLAFLAISQAAEGDVSFVATFPQTVRSGSSLTIPVNIFPKSDSSLNNIWTGGLPTLQVQLIENNTTVLATATGAINIQTDGFSATSLVELTIPAVSATSIDFEIEITLIDFFSKRAPVEVLADEFIVFIETDKPIYKPSEVVKALILTVDTDLKPVTGAELTVEIINPAEFRIARRSVVTDLYGMGTIEFALASEPPLGDWSAVVLRADGSVVTDIKFKVDKYVLPDFKVEIVPSTTLLAPNTKVLQGDILAKYTYGKGVNGQATVQVTQQMMWYWGGGIGIIPEVGIGAPAPGGGGIAPGGGTSSSSPGSYNPLVASVTVPIKSGKGTYSIDISTLNLVGNLVIDVTVTEEGTGSQENASADIEITYSNKKLTLSGDSKVKPGLPLNIILECTLLQNSGSSPCADERYFLQFSYSNAVRWSHEMVNITTVGGQGKYQWDVPLGLNYVSVSAFTSDYSASAYNPDLKLAYSPSNSFLQVKPTQEKLYKVGDTLTLNYEFNINNTILPANLFLECDAFNRQQLVATASVPIANPSATQSGSLSFPITDTFISHAQIVCLATIGNEVVADSYTVNVQEELPVNLELSFTKTQVLPGEDVQLNINSQTAAQVAISAVDESVYLLANSTRLDISAIFDAMNEETNTYQWFQSYSADIIFQKAGVVVLTSETIPSSMGGKNGVFPVDIGMGGGAEDANGGAPPPANSGVVPESTSTSTTTVSARVRKFFPESWLWGLYPTDAQGLKTLSLTAPDSITTFSVQGISLSPLGLGIAETKITTFQPFFVDLDLPYAIVRGEQVPLTVVVYNYLDTEITSTITLANSNNFAVVPSNKVGIIQYSNTEDTLAQGARSATLTVQPNSLSVHRFIIEPLILGTIQIQATAQTNNKADSLIKDVIVIPEGIENTLVINNLISLDALPSGADINSQSVTYYLNTTLPDDIIPGSVRAIFSCTGDIMGQTIQNLDQLVNFPTGCGEQTMIGLAPNIYVIDYIQATGQAKPDLVKKAKEMISIGYQHELTYRHDDNSFSAFGEQDRDGGSSWLTSFVVKCFAQASRYVFIDSEVIRASAEYLLATQANDGSFPIIGNVIHQELYGGLKGVVPNTAFTVIALLEAGYIENAKVSRALTYLEQQLPTTDVYGAAIITYALSLAQRPSSQTGYARVMSLAIRDNSGVHWTNANADAPAVADPCFWCPQSSSADVEITAYVLLSSVLLNEMGDAVEIARWLLQQRNALGGFRSTQDTVIALQSLSAYAAVTRSDKINMNIELTDNMWIANEFDVNNQNFDLLQSEDIEVKSDNFSLIAHGEGKVQTQLVVYFNTKSRPSLPVYDFTVDYTVNGDVTTVKACVTYYGAKPTTGMALVRIGLFTGTRAIRASLEKLLKTNQILRYEINEADRSVSLYLNTFTKDTELCLTFDVTPIRDVAFLAPATSSVFTYYAPQEVSSIAVASANIGGPVSPASSGGLSEGAKAGIAIGVIVGAAIVVVAAIVYSKRKKGIAAPHVELSDQPTGDI